MYNHAPKDYICPFCLIVKGIENEHVLTKQDDIVYKDDYITAFIGAGWWNNNKGHVIIIPNNHFENIYELPNEFSAKIHEFEKEIAIAFKKVYKCDGVSSRRHNEHCGNQDVWHYHLHVFPRYKNDNLYLTGRELSKPEERLEYAEKLKNYFKEKDKSNIIFKSN
ncbi:HIT family protein [Clostridium tagluense]|uniref:HIT family protein n=1 Tax=Clostridium tagluense TaxID=360422 RepID=UPI001CF232E1|nr:HIT family protein [Clostridium tagluense]MCB2298153.1 HIT family protein [Clostridium tagluense]